MEENIPVSIESRSLRVLRSSLWVDLIKHIIDRIIFTSNYCTTAVKTYAGTYIKLFRRSKQGHFTETDFIVHDYRNVW